MRFAEELLLLLLDDERGDLTASLSRRQLHLLLGGAVLMDLAFENRIDTDVSRLMLIDPKRVGDDLLDPTLGDIARDPKERDTEFWVLRQARRGSEIRECALARLTERGILESGEVGASVVSRSVSRARRYRSAGGTMREEVRLRIMRVLFSDDVPDPRDVALISLADAGGIFSRVLYKSELTNIQDRIDLVKQLDLLGQVVARAVQAAAEAVSDSPDATRPASQIPLAPGLPIVGNAVAMYKDTIGFLLKQYHALGPIFRVRTLDRQLIVLAGAEANQFLARGDAYLRTGPIWNGFNADFFGAGRQIISMDSDAHFRMRKHQTSVESQELLNGRVADAVDIARMEIASWSRKRSIPARLACQRMVIEQLGSLATGMSPRDYLDDILVFFNALLSVDIVRTRPKLMTPSRRVRRARRRVLELARRILENHDPKRRRSAEPDYVDEVVALHRADPKFLPEVDLPVNVLGPFLVGLETVASTCARMLYVLLAHPDLLERATAEADALLGGGVPSIRALRELDVTRRIAMETRRCYPLAPAVPRMVANSFEFQGYRVPAGERVLVAVALPHRMEEYFPDPERFDIDRYTPERSEHRQPGAYAPFSERVRRCLGSGVAEALIALNMATILHEAKLALVPRDYEMRMTRWPLSQPEDSFRFRLTGRRR